MFRCNRLIRILFLQYYCVVLLGAPVPLAPAQETIVDAAPRFPCERGSCGCSAKHCWSSCCCHSLSDRLAWAKRNKIRPPRTALRAAARVGLDITPWCDSEIESFEKVIDRASSLGKKLCPSEESGLPGENSEGEKQHLNSPTVLILRAMSCRGITFAWHAVVAAPLPPPITSSPHAHVDSVAISAALISSPDNPAPPTPPPRRRLLIRPSA